MKREITFGNLLAILVPTFIVILTWGNSVETRLKEHSIRISNLERSQAKIETKLDEIVDNQTKILIELQNKKNRDQ